MEVGGRPVLERILDAVGAAGLTDVVIAARDFPRFSARLRESGLVRAGMGARLIEDEVPGLGPVAGFAAGLAEARGAVAVVLGGDLPFIDGSLVSALFDAIEADPEAGALVPTVAGRDQPLCAAYRRGPALAAAQDLLRTARPGDAGPSVAALLDRLTVRRLETVGDAGEAELAVRTRGIDTPEDLEWARQRAAGSAD